MIARRASHQTGEIPAWIETREATTPPSSDHLVSTAPELREESMGHPEAHGLSDD